MRLEKGQNSSRYFQIQLTFFTMHPYFVLLKYKKRIYAGTNSIAYISIHFSSEDLHLAGNTYDK